MVVEPGEIATFNMPISGTGSYQTDNGEITFAHAASFSGAGSGADVAGTLGHVSAPGLEVRNGGLLSANRFGNLTANGPAGIVANGGGNLVGLNGSNIVALGGGNIVALGGGNVISGNGSTIVALGGGNKAANKLAAAALRGSAKSLSPATSAIIAQAGGTITGDATFEADNGVWIEDGGSLVPGYPLGTLTVTGTLDLAAGSLLTAEIGGLAAGSQHDRVVVSGALTIGGNLRVTMANGFVPALGDTFTILSADSVTGTFSSLGLPALSGRRIFRVGYSAQAVTLSVGLIDSYSDWALSRFTIEEQADPLVSGPDADTDDDGQSNWFEYFSGSEPTLAGSRAPLSSGLITLPNGDQFITLTFPRAPEVPTASLAIEHNPDLADPLGWTDVAFEITATVPGDGTDLVTVRVLQALGADPQGF